MQISRKLNRRSFLASVTGTIVSGAALIGVARPAEALQLTDCDRGAGADPAGRGSGRTRRTGTTDRDGGAAADPPSCGRGSAPVQPGPQPDTSGGYGHRPPVRGYTGFTDRDPTDRAGYGRGGTGSRNYTGVSDSDSGPSADPAGSGRGGAGSRSSYGAHNIQGRDCNWLLARQRELQAQSSVGFGSREASQLAAEELRAIERSLQLCR